MHRRFSESGQVQTQTPETIKCDFLTHELSEEKSAKFDRVDHLWPHKAGD